MSMKILVGLDGSPCGYEALRQAAMLSDESDLLVLYFSPPEVRLRDHGGDPQWVQRAREALAEQIFKQARDQLPQARRDNVKTVVDNQPPQIGLPATAEAEAVDWMAVGARGLGPLKRVLLGSVSTAVVHTARVPVLVARSPKGVASQAAREFTALLAYDESPAAEAAVKLLGRLHWPEHVTGYVMTVIESLLAGDVPDWLREAARDAQSEAMARAWVEEHEEEKRQKLAMLQSLQQRLPQPFASQQPIVAEGHAAKAILDVAEGQHIDLIVMGARGLGPLGRLLIGSTSDKVLHHAGCSVLIVRQPEG